MKDWPLLLVAACFLLGAAGRYIAEGGSNDMLSAVAACLGSAAFGAWLYSLGQQALEARYDTAGVINEEKK